MRLAVAAAALTLSFATEAAAEPTLWQRARSPNARAEAGLLGAVEHMLDAREQAGADDELAEHFARAAVAFVDLARLREPEDPRLACAMAQALLAANLGRNVEAEALLVRAVPKLPPGGLLARAWHELGMARSIRGDHAGARDADTHVLELAWDAGLRATSFYNRAEAEMRLGELTRAVHDYQDGAESAREPAIQALSRFGLGVALERQGDLPGAYAALDQGLAIRLPLSLYASDDPLELSDVFFSPPYERFYLKALIAMARARHADDQTARRLAYEQAVSQWDAYLLAAAPSEPWLDNAHRHRERAVAELTKLPRRHARKH